AAPLPTFSGCSTIRMRGGSARRRSTSRVPSVEPSSTSTISCTCGTRSTRSSTRSIVARSLKTGTTTLSRSVAAHASSSRAAPRAAAQSLSRSSSKGEGTRASTGGGRWGACGAAPIVGRRNVEKPPSRARGRCRGPFGPRSLSERLEVRGGGRRARRALGGAGGPGRERAHERLGERVGVAERFDVLGGREPLFEDAVDGARDEQRREHRIAREQAAVAVAARERVAQSGAQPGVLLARVAAQRGREAIAQLDGQHAEQAAGRRLGEVEPEVGRDRATQVRGAVEGVVRPGHGAAQPVAPVVEGREEQLLLGTEVE